MGALMCNCPQDAAIASVPIDNCPEEFGQTQKIILQRIYSTGTTKNSTTIASANPNLLATWTALLAATAGTKVVPSPFLNAPVNEPGAARYYGGGNDTVGGLRIVIGREPSTFTANILRTSSKTIEALKTYQCETVGVYLVDEFGRIAGLVDNLTTPTKFFPIPIHEYFVADKALGGLEAPDMNGISWGFAPNWSDKFYIVKPTDFNGLELATPA